MRWRDLTWLERIWVYNSLLGMAASAGFFFLLFDLARQESQQMSVTQWAIFLGQIFWALCFVFCCISTVDRVLGPGGTWRGRKALMTRGVRGFRKTGHFTVVAYPEGESIKLRVTRLHRKLRLWPLGMPVTLEIHGDFSRTVKPEDQREIAEALSDLSDQARRQNQQARLSGQNRSRSERIAGRVNQQRP